MHPLARGRLRSAELPNPLSSPPFPFCSPFSLFLPLGVSAGGRLCPLPGGAPFLPGFARSPWAGGPRLPRGRAAPPLPPGVWPRRKAKGPDAGPRAPAQGQRPKRRAEGPQDFGLLSAGEKGKALRLAVIVFDAMVRQGIKPDIVSYSALISACAKGQELRVAVNACDATQRQSVGYQRCSSQASGPM